MSRGFKILAGLILFCAIALTAYWLWHHNLEIFPRDVCYSRDGLELGSYNPRYEEICLEDDKRPLLQKSMTDAEMGMSHSLDADSHRACQLLCKEHEWCSHYIFHLPYEYYNRDGPPPFSGVGGFVCSLFEQRGR